MLTLRIRGVAGLLVLLLVAAAAGPAFAACAGWSASAADRHACCAGRGDLASEASITNCCAASEQLNDVAPPESQAARTLVKLLGADVSPVPDLFLPSHARALMVSSTLLRSTPVPLYLQEVSLLI